MKKKLIPVQAHLGVIKIIGHLDEDTNKFFPNENYSDLYNFHKINNKDVMINISKTKVNNVYDTYFSFAEKCTDRTLIYFKS
jgi:hypothetical protein